MKNKQEANEKIVKVARNNDYTAANLLDYLYRQLHYKPICIDLSRHYSSAN